MNPPGEKPTGPDNASDPQQPTAGMLLWAYTHGVFPMHDPHSDLIEWFSPDPRGMIPLESFRMPRNVARAVRQDRFRIRSDSAFEAVMRACAAPRAEENPSWIDDRLIAAYTELYEQGHAHSVHRSLQTTRWSVLR